MFEKRLAALLASGAPELLQGGRRGVEKESLRVTPAGLLAQTPHPVALGSALTSEHITTDYSEALIELVTPTFNTNWELLQYLLDLHQFVYRHLGDELLWATSMPCRIERDEDIPIARYGRSHIGRMKSIYREGLGVRYGRMMQAISGVHFNYSFPSAFWPAYAGQPARGVIAFLPELQLLEILLGALTGDRAWNAVKTRLVDHDGQRRLEHVEIDFLRHHADATLGLLELPVDVITEDAGLAAGFAHQRGHDADQRRLAGTVRPEEREEIPFLDGEIDALQGLYAVAVGFGQALDGKRVHSGLESLTGRRDAMARAGD